MNTKSKQIIDAAHQLFIEKGFALTSIQDILDKAGVAKGTFYNYFDSKNECLRAILKYVTEEVDRKRREIAIGKEDDDEEVFIEQMAVRMNMNRQHHLLVMFETVSFSDDVELKSFMKEQHRAELQWITKRLGNLYPPKAKAYTLDHAVMLVGIVQHMMHVWRLGSQEEIATEKVIRYALTRVKSMINEQAENEEAFLPENWLTFTSDNSTADLKREVRNALEELLNKTEGKDSSKRQDYLKFLLSELQAEAPRTFLVESVLISLEHAFNQSEYEHEVQHIVKTAWRVI
ncbi:TetR/AcrR family transcriptional regulator [Aquibacillus sp. 3ASR75-11]|uniref:TetR/AcrR family transcriptional regulator n=1 Tax=Terrihalobacillus insolitus TaxID=2950438 RepID=A0A9X4AKB1_9BACI|nr:TetR/AcrR family transcriptional regulator [Terrihalobacillus insolitus]MDC3412209.1 TetR/AcrR family transcriptional regulator [Terrihalobacillus insolitus]MDC3423097.1 TetR/AcrR family transcriptional regulator [Terrihalobacillus insolitus]